MKVEEEFARFMARYGRSYEDIEEYAMRLLIFKSNLEAIGASETNLAITQFADRSKDEFRL